LADLRALIAIDPAFALAIAGLVAGCIFGAVLSATGFCTMGALSDMMAFGDGRRLRSWLLAVAVAILGAHALELRGVVSLDQSIYRSSQLNWAGHLLGGSMFGFGMVLAGGCASRNLVRAGEGDLRAGLTLLVVGLFAYMTTGGVLGPWRVELEDATAISLPGGARGLADLAAYMMTGGLADGGSRAAVSGGPEHMSLAFLVAAGLLVYCVWSAPFRRSAVHIFSGLAVGAVIIAGWALTGLAHDEFALVPQAPLSLSFVKPTGDALEWLQRATALGPPSFGAASIFGTVIGAFVISALSGRVQIATFAGTDDTLRNLAGASLMGVGGVMALGCSIGQGVSGLSTLAIGSVVAVLGIVAGGIAGLKALERMA
jgi:uncharacterized protein